MTEIGLTRAIALRTSLCSATVIVFAAKVRILPAGHIEHPRRRANLGESDVSQNPCRSSTLATLEAQLL
jgi:hypothetical protein